MLIPAEAIPAVHADIFHVASILLAVKANFYERKRRKDKVRKCCRFFGLYAGEEVILDESSVPSLILNLFLSEPAILESTSGGSSSSQEAVFLIPDV
jgi:hypothetical protein